MRFPGNGQAPTVSGDAMPPATVGAVPSGVLIDPNDAMTMVSYDGWYVRFTSEQVVEINRSRARRPVGRVFRRVFGRDAG